jgi:LemA protein
MKPIYWITAAIALGIGFLMVFNRLIRLKNQVNEAWSGVDVQLKRRHDLVPTLVECVRGYQVHEKGLFDDLAQSRARAVEARGASSAAPAEQDLGGRLRALVALAEAYPDLKAGQNFSELSRNLVEIEDHLQYARRFYNGSVRDLNNLVESFPSRIVAGMCGFARAEFFEIESATERNTPEVRL